MMATAARTKQLSGGRARTKVRLYDGYDLGRGSTDLGTGYCGVRAWCCQSGGRTTKKDESTFPEGRST